ncbi:MAG: non-canonical purine NTP pyrophosphatase [Proteobacteria bacterium]|nr:non-canonical purine NTP pyrophosphatase [Pseudomonadota bacterium]
MKHQPVCILASSNAHKLKELKMIFSLLERRWDVITAQDILGFYDPPLEDHKDYWTNSLLKVTALQDALKEQQERLQTVLATYTPKGSSSRYVVLADDSGLEVEALAGNPGVYSARYAGDHASDEENMEKLLKAMHHMPAAHLRCARMVSVVTLWDGDVYRQSRGVLSGLIASQTRYSTTSKDQKAFGYDPLFIPLPHEAIKESHGGFTQEWLARKTLGQICVEEKNQLSHRYRALKQLFAL